MSADLEPYLMCQQVEKLAEGQTRVEQEQETQMRRIEVPSTPHGENYSLQPFSRCHSHFVVHLFSTVIMQSIYSCDSHYVVHLVGHCVIYQFSRVTGIPYRA